MGKQLHDSDLALNCLWMEKSVYFLISRPASPRFYEEIIIRHACAPQSFNMSGDIYLISKDGLLARCERIADRQDNLDYVLLSVNRVASARCFADNLHSIKLTCLIL